MKVQEILNPVFGKAFSRFSLAMQKYFKSITFSQRINNPDFYFLHVVGGEEYNLLKEGRIDIRKTIIFQHCVLTTKIDVWDWVEIWRNAPLVLAHSPIPGNFDRINFYRTPLGAEPSLFRDSDTYREVKVFTTGHVAETECIDLLALACQKTGNVLYHTGENFGYPARNYQFLPYLPDDAYSALLRRTQYVAGLRKVEGFELHCIEGAMSGCVPIVPNEPSYDFYKDFAVFVDTSQSDEKIVQQLSQILPEYRRLDKEKVNYVRDYFSWERIIQSIEKEILRL